MNFEERIDRLTERHEALAESVELMGQQLGQVIGALAQDAENIRSLARIAERNEREHEAFREEMRTMREQMHEEMRTMNRETDERIRNLTSAVGELIRRMPLPPANNA